MSKEGSQRPDAAGPADQVEIRDLPRSEEELAAAQAEEVVGGAQSAAVLCWIQSVPKGDTVSLDSCWIENNKKIGS